jgi:hypothetical protein
MTTLVRITHRLVLVGMALALIVAGAAPMLDGPEATAARKGKQAQEKSGLSAALVQRLENPRSLTMGDGAVADTSAIEVSGFSAPIADVDVTLLDITFGPASSQDMDVLLIGPEGRTAFVLSDVGGNTATNNVTLLLDDEAPDKLPNPTALTTGIFQPTNVGTGDTIDGGGGPITPASGASLGVFNGINPNGTWRIFAFDDDSNGNVGSIAGGWRLRITTANGVPAANGESFQATAKQPLTVPANGVLGNDSDPDGDPLTAILAGQPRQGTLTLAADGGFTYTPNKKAKGSDSFTYLAQDPSGLNALATVDFQIKAKKPKKKGKKRR